MEEEAMEQATMEETAMEEATSCYCTGGNNGAGNGGFGGTSSEFEKTLNCPPGSSVFSSCTGTHCLVTCGNGKQVRK